MNKMIPSEIINAEGAIKLKSGLAPVFTDNFELQNNESTYECTFIDYGEFKNTGFHLLYFSFDNGTSQTLGLGSYYTDNQKVTSFDIYGVSIVDQEFQIVSLPDTNLVTIPTYTSIATRPQNIIAVSDKVTTLYD